MKSLVEGSCEFTFSPQEFINRKMSVFYNPRMKHNRDVTVAFIGAYKWKQSPITLGLAMEASGTRGIRIVKENPHLSFSLHMNDHNETAVRIMNEQIQKNKILSKITQLDSDDFFSQSDGFDFIDLDPFGSPVPYLDAAIKRLTFGGVLAVTATDTAALCGASQKACIRKYWALPARGPYMYEVGLRILIRRVQLIGLSYEKALVPVLSYVKDHYMRVFFVCRNDVEKLWDLQKVVKVDGLEVGPMYTGKLHDTSYFNIETFFSKIADDSFAKKLREEFACDTFLYYPIQDLCKEYTIPQQPRPSLVVAELRRKKYIAAQTVNCLQAVKTNAPRRVVISLIKKLGANKT